MTRHSLIVHVWRLGALLGMAWLGLNAPAAGATQPCTDAPLLTPAGPEVWVWQGADEDVAPNNAGHVVTNVVLLNTGSAPPFPATVIDPGPSLRHAQALNRAIECQLNARVARVINTHAHAETVLGNVAWRSPSEGQKGVRPPILATARTRQQMEERCPDCLDHLTHTAGAEALKGTRITLPDAAVNDGDVLQWTRQRWQLMDVPRAHTHSDLVLWQPETRTLIAAGLVYGLRLPELAQGSLLGWIAALDRLAALRPARVIGLQVGGPESIARTRTYLCDLAATVWEAMDRGLSASEAESLKLPSYRSWAGYRERQPFNAQRAWRELEPLWMAGAPRPACSPPDVVR